MKAIVVSRPGEPEVLKLVDIPTPPLGPDDVLIETAAVSIESGDLLMRRHGHFSSTPPEPLGYASAGTIVQAGTNLPAAVIGQRVVSFGFSGAYAEFRAAPLNACFPIPDGLAASTAVAAFIGPATAGLAVRLAEVRADDTVLVLGGAGAVGFAVMQMARELGAGVIATVRSEASRDELRAHGFESVLVARDGTSEGKLAKLCPDGKVSVIIDTVGGEALQRANALIGDGGRIVIVGITGAGDHNISTTLILTRRLTIRGCFLGAMITDPDVAAMVRRIFARVLAGGLTVPIQGVFPLHQASLAHGQAENPTSLGKTILLMDE